MSLFRPMPPMRLIIALLCIFTTHVSNAEVALHPFNGKKIPFSSLRGKWVFINYWASWCQPCLNEIPELNQFYKDNRKNQMALFAVNYDMLPEKMQKKLIKKYQVHYPSLKQDPAEALHLGDIAGVPITFVFNPQGQLIKTLYGEQTAEGLTQFLTHNALLNPLKPHKQPVNERKGDPR